jgi:hypothetical protein
MIDFGDGLLGPREYDWLGPLCFFVKGQAARADAFFGGYGMPVPHDQGDALLRLLPKHTAHVVRTVQSRPCSVVCSGWPIWALMCLAHRPQLPPRKAPKL